MSEGNRTRYSYCPEVTPGTTPATPTFKELRRTGGGLKLKQTTVKSDEVRADRMRRKGSRTERWAEGSLNFEFSYESFDDMLEAALFGTWTAPVSISGTDISFTASTKTVGSVTTNLSALAAGQKFVVDGSASNDGVLTASTVAAHAVVVDETLVDELAGATVGLSSDGMLRNGTTAKSFSFEQGHEDINQYFQFRGCYIDGLKVDVPAAGKITGSIDVMGMSGSRTTSTVRTALTAANDNDILNGTSNISDVTEGAAAMDELLKVSIEIKNNLRKNNVVGLITPKRLKAGTSEVSGSIEVYFQDGTLVDKYLNFDESSLSFRIDAPEGFYIVTIPAYTYSGDTPDATGLDEDTKIVAPFTAHKDPSFSRHIQIDRFAA